MADQKNLTQATKKKEEEFRISKEVDAKLDVIKKNIDFCNENGTPEALKEGGKYYNSFRKLIDGTVLIELTELKEKLLKLLPIPKKSSTQFTDLIQKMLDENRAMFFELTESLNEEAIRKEMESVSKKYADNYVELQLQRF